MSSNGEMKENPPWLDKPFLEKVLKESEEYQNVTVNSFQATRGTAPGDNYSSDIFRVQVSFTQNGEQESMYFLIKAVLPNEDLYKVIEETGAFPREATCLSCIVPKMYKMLSEISTVQFKPFSARCFYSQYQVQPYMLVLEDLKQKGFKMAKRLIGLDMKHSLLVMQQMARYHATSAILYQKNPELFEPVKNSKWSEESRTILEAFFEKSMKKLASQIAEWPGYERFAPKYKKIADNCVDLLINTVRRDESDFNAFVHGDMWCNNMMFCYSENDEVEQVRFLDYQLCHYSSPTLDIHYFLHTSVSLKLLDKHQYFIEEYYKTLEETFSLLGHQHLAPTFTQLQKQVEDKGIFSVIMSGTVLPFILADPTVIPDVDKISKESKDESSIPFSETMKTAVKTLLPEFERRGWL